LSDFLKQLADPPSNVSPHSKKKAEKLQRAARGVTTSQNLKHGMLQVTVKYATRRAKIFSFPLVIWRALLALIKLKKIFKAMEMLILEFGSSADNFL
jgi:hypothetical protein